MKFPWYKKLKGESDIQQGDFVDNCPIVLPPVVIKPQEEVPLDILLMDVIILSQSCDLANDKVEYIFACPYSKLPDFFESLPPGQTKTKKARRKIIDNLRKGQLVAYHLLNKEESLFDNYLVVDFRNIYSISRPTLINTVKGMDERVRLLPPYREHLSQAFARYFMRVGLPQDIDISDF